MRRLAIIFATLWAAGAGLWFAVGPVYATMTTAHSLAPSGATAPAVPSRVDRTSGMDINGPRIALVLMVPVLLAAMPLLTRNRAPRRSAGTAAGLMFAFCLLGAASVGILYLPSAIALALAAALPRAVS